MTTTTNSSANPQQNGPVFKYTQPSLIYRSKYWYNRTPHAVFMLVGGAGLLSLMLGVFLPTVVAVPIVTALLVLMYVFVAKIGRTTPSYAVVKASLAHRIYANHLWPHSPVEKQFNQHTTLTSRKWMQDLYVLQNIEKFTYGEDCHLSLFFHTPLGNMSVSNSFRFKGIPKTDGELVMSAFKAGRDEAMIGSQLQKVHLLRKIDQLLYATASDIVNNTHGVRFISTRNLRVSPTIEPKVVEDPHDNCYHTRHANDYSKFIDRQHNNIIKLNHMIDEYKQLRSVTQK